MIRLEFEGVHLVTRSHAIEVSTEELIFIEISWLSHSLAHDSGRVLQAVPAFDHLNAGVVSQALMEFPLLLSAPSTFAR